VEGAPIESQQSPVSTQNAFALLRNKNKVPARCVQNIYKTVCVHHFYTFLFLRICTYDLLKTVCILSSNSYAPLSHSFSAYRAFMCIC
jgi:hypothetical protein